jgi:phosphoribosylglycinamide formyltransferase-1
MSLKYVLFAYDFPHTKTKDFILLMKKLGYDISCIIAAPKVQLNLPESKIRTSVKSSEYFHPKCISKMLDIPYYVAPHNSNKSLKLLKKQGADVGVIGGARIISEKIIDTFSYGVINFHPGIIPENRGLDNLKWAIHLDIQQGVTAHFIDKRVDAGRIILKNQVPIYLDDTLFDTQQRLYETQLKLAKPTFDKIIGKKIEDFPLVRGGEVRSMMPNELEKDILKKFEKYKKKYGIIREKS